MIFFVDQTNPRHVAPWLVIDSDVVSVTRLAKHSTREAPL
jgi:hypothetical protein